MALGKVLKGMLDDFSKDYINDDLEESKAFEYFMMSGSKGSPRIYGTICSGSS